MLCWETVLAFHKFYQKIEEAHNRLEAKATIIDGLPLKILLKAEDDPSQVESPFPAAEFLNSGEFEAQTVGESNIFYTLL